MTKETAFEICKFIGDHYDMVRQEDWFKFQDVLLDAVVRDANMGGFAKSLVKEFPYFFGTKE